jgi:hypothetical protein
MFDFILTITAVLVAVVTGTIIFLRPRLRTVTLVASAALAVIIGGLFWFYHAMNKYYEAATGPAHVFIISNQPPAITWSFAVEKAKAALVLDGFREDFQLVTSRTNFPMNDRMEPQLKSDFLTFTNAAGNHLSVHVELSGDKLICQRRPSL